MSRTSRLQIQCHAWMGLGLLAVLLLVVSVGCEKDPTPPPPPTGACCVTAGTCTVIAQAACSGTWTAGVCTPNPCVQPTGSCCAVDGGCTVTTQAVCAGTSTWTLAGVCDPNTCPTQPPPPSGMVLISAGTFTMGSPGDEPGREPNETQHEVTLTKAIYVSIHEVTQSEWQAVMGWNESYYPGANRPVQNVTWYDAVSYCNRRSVGEGLTAAYTITDSTRSGNHIINATVTWNQAADGYRLLTEAEWEYAARATSTTALCNGPITNSAHDCGADPGLDLVGWYCGNAGTTTHLVIKTNEFFSFRLDPSFTATNVHFIAVQPSTNVISEDFEATILED
jgi:hypothetical protein